MKEKRIYEPCVIELTHLSLTDVIATSGWELGGEGGTNSDPNGWT